jgi:predicted DNA-binding transcriptional regulator AlpA
VDQTTPRPLDPPTYTVPKFCAAHHISRSYLYELWRDGRGPRRAKLGRRTLITGEAAAAWRRELERDDSPTPALAATGA